MEKDQADAAPTPRALETPEPTGDARTDALRQLMAVVDRLRDPDGCPWDLEQTMTTVAPHLIEEAHEVLEAVETGRDTHVAEESGDLLMGIFLLARIAEQEGRFDLAHVATGVTRKLVRRHPHVFGDGSADSSAAALVNWEAVKRAERAEKAEDTSALAGVPKALPALQRARRMGEKAIAAGFRWSDERGALAKVGEEARELEQAFEDHAAARASNGGDEQARAQLEHELGDVLIAASFLGNYVGIDPERALRQALRRFEARFRHMESALGVPLSGCSLERMIGAWQVAKRELAGE